MTKVKVKVKLDKSKLKRLEKASETALKLTAEAILADIITRQVVPFEEGELSKSGDVVEAEGIYQIIFSTPYARRLYWHPEYNFRTDKNPNAEGKWMDHYLSGEGLEFVITAYMTFFKQEAKGLIT
jgi:hypothetical protein